MRKVAVILPTYNEAKNIEEAVTKIFSVAETIPGWELYVVVVDSASPDGTATIVARLRQKFPYLELIRTKKEGLGKAYVEGFTQAMSKLNPYVFFEMDADLSHNPDDIPRFLKKIEEGADFVVGSRYLPGGAIPQDWEIHRKLFSIFGNLIIRIGFMKFSVTEWTNGFRAIKSWVVKKHLSHLQHYTGYVFQVAFLDKALKSGARVVEIPVKFIDRVEGSSKINSFEYIMQTLLYVFRASSFVKYVIVGGIGFVIDFGISFIFIEIMKAAVWFSTIISAETAIVSNFLLNNEWSFKHKRLNRKSNNLIWSFFKFNLVASGSLIIQTVGMSAATHFLGIEFWYIYKILIIVFIIIPYSYFFYNKVVWKDN